MLVRLVVPDRLTDEERELYTRLLEIEGKKTSAKGAKKGFFQDIADKGKESVK